MSVANETGLQSTLGPGVQQITVPGSSAEQIGELKLTGGSVEGVSI